MSKFKPSKYQAAIHEEVKHGKTHISVNAVAGSGKTTTIEESLAFIKSFYDVAFCAFNNEIVDELGRRVKRRNTRISTIHSIGWTAIKNYFGRDNCHLDEYKAQNLAFKMFSGKGYKTSWGYIYNLVKLVDLLRCDMSFSVMDVENLAYKHDINIENGTEAQDALDLFSAMLDDTTTFDFTDMVFMPTVVPDMELPKFDFVFTDECLPFYMPVLLADGTSLPIGEIVENKLNLSVLSFNTETGQQEFCKITNWSKSINNKKLYKIKVRTKDWKTYFVVCTFNHKLYANGVWIDACDIKEGMLMQVETSAKKTQKYKITKSGTDNLRDIMSEKNKSLDFKSDRTKGLISSNNRGGNGRVNELQNMFLSRLIGDWKSEYVVKTKNQKHIDNYPSNYKIDIANYEFKIAIELDGCSHNSKEAREKDAKKDNFLTLEGWKVFRIKNKHLVADFDEYVDLFNKYISDNLSVCDNGIDCPVDAVVVSIDDIELPDDKFVYDITVEECHNFYANGILVHNCQDLNKPQQFIVTNMLANDKSRLISVGDKHQAIYGFAAADTESFDNLANRPNTKKLPLSICYRCAKNIVLEAQKIVPHIEPFELSPDGIVRTDGDIDEIRSGDWVICRNTKPLVVLCLELIKQHKKAQVKGKDIGKNLTALIKSIKVNNKILSLKLMERKLEKLFDELKDRGISKPQLHNKYISLKEKIEIIEYISIKMPDMASTIKLLDSIFTDEVADIMLMTIHRSKGRENERVFFLLPQLIPSKYAKQYWQIEQEQNLKYVGITRAKTELIYINNFDYK